MKERPILMSAPMVRATLDGSKTQTRRLWKLPKWAEWDCIQGGEATGSLIPKDPSLRGWYGVDEVACPYDQPGDQLWVRETWTCVHGVPTAGGVPHHDDFVRYRADDGASEKLIDNIKCWHPSIHMPRVYSRILLEIVSVRVERLQDISEADAWAEGCQRGDPWDNGKGFFPAEQQVAEGSWIGWDNALEWYADLWESLNGPNSWNANPWVWVIEFKVVKE